MEIPFVVMNDFVLCDVPDECWEIKGKDGNTIKLAEDKPNLKDRSFEVLSVGQNVSHLRVGDKVRFDDFEKVNAVKIMGKSYLYVQGFDINIRLKREGE
jgi:hypothetical protein